MKENVKIIIAEDDAGHFQLVKQNLWLSCFNHEILHFKNGQEVLDFLSEQKNIDANSYILILDIRMPKMDGYEVLEKIKADQELKKIPVIMLTTTAEESEIQKCYELGCSFYMVKPVDYQQFMNVVDSLGCFLSLENIRLVS